MSLSRVLPFVLNLVTYLLLVVLKYSDTNYILKYATMLLLFSTHFRLVWKDWLVILLLNIKAESRITSIRVLSFPSLALLIKFCILYIAHDL